jgi:dTDP-4-dehydrorhamnose reductase
MKILVLGASGMIGSAIFRVLSKKNAFEVWGSIRSNKWKDFFSPNQQGRLVICEDLLDQTELNHLFSKIQPDTVINCVGLTKHNKDANDILLAVPLNTLLPHRLANLCKAYDARLVHISTDCIFSGLSGNYAEADLSDAIDVYGKSKFLGEVIYCPHAVTLRTSTIGHELQSSYGLLEWFLSQQGSCTGFNKAIFSGLPNTVFAEIIRDHVIQKPQLHGLYHVGGPPIGKYDLLKLIAAEYGKDISIQSDDTFSINRSLNSDLFSAATGYSPPSWPELIRSMHKSQEDFNVSK